MECMEGCQCCLADLSDICAHLPITPAVGCANTPSPARLHAGPVCSVRSSAGCMIFGSRMLRLVHVAYAEHVRPKNPAASRPTHPLLLTASVSAPTPLNFLVCVCLPARAHTDRAPPKRAGRHAGVRGGRSDRVLSARAHRRCTAPRPSVSTCSAPGHGCPPASPPVPTLLAHSCSCARGRCASACTSSTPKPSARPRN